MRLFKSIVIIVGFLFFFVLGGFIALFIISPQTVSLIYLFYNPLSPVNYEAINTVPQDYIISQPPKNYQYKGSYQIANLTVKMPWETTIEHESTNSARLRIFDNDTLIVEKVMSEYPGISNLSNQNSVELYEKMFGKNPTPYTHTDIILSATLDDMSLSDDFEISKVKQIKLILKKLVVSALPDKLTIYRFKINQVKGFMLYGVNKYAGEADKKLYNIMIFDPEDSQYSIIILSENVTQEEIDYLLSSLQISTQIDK